MIETILKVDGMMCGMCESHVNETVRKTADVKKVTSSHTKGETVILSEQELDIDTLKAAIAETGYTVKGAQSHPYEKKGCSINNHLSLQEVRFHEDLSVRCRRAGL